MRRIAILAVLLSPALFACSSGVPVEDAVASINEEDYLRKIWIIAHDSMGGRANPSPGLDMTAQWIAQEFERYGLEPGGDDGSFIQYYRIREMAVDFDASSVQVVGGPTLELGVDVNVSRASGGGEVSGGVVIFVGSLASAQDFPAEQFAGNHVFIVPSGTPQRGRRRMRAPRGMTDAEPASVFFVDSSSDEDWEAAAERARAQRVTRGPWDDGSSTGLSILSIRASSLEPILAAQGVSLARLSAGSDEAAVIQVPGLEITVRTAMTEVGHFDMPNTVGILEGSDPDLRDEHIVYSAHMDHVNSGRMGEEGDTIWNGADDDGSGTIAVVELAEAFAMLSDPPKRSMVFLAVSGEERGLWGSRFFAENPGFPREQMVANLNADMISRNAPDSIVVIGKEHSDLGETMNQVNAQHPELNLTAADDIWPEQNFYRRSDHFNFARRGVPILFFFCGTHEDYHGVDDEVEKMDITKATNVTKLMFHLGLEVGNAAEKPQWDPESRAEIVDMGG